MKQKFRRFKEMVKRFTHNLEWYFLGVKPKSRFLGSGRIYLDGHDLYDRPLINDDRSEIGNIFSALKISVDLAHDLPVVFVMPSLMVPAKNLSNSLKELGLLVFPQTLEEVSAMVEQISRQIPDGFLLILFNISMLPSKKDMDINLNNAGLSGTHERAYQKMLYAIFRLQGDRSIFIAFAEHESLLGKKNSALLRRLYAKKILNN